ncbi:DUF3348 family protein [Ideonella sp.]|uniref:DUF3348 family protein n=1 Tax=Ideonella sp. TaxID=1929293 RepID=UPI0035B0DA5F
MARGTPRTRLPSSDLIRQLARLTDADAPGSTQTFAEELSQWLGWTDAIELATALNTTPAVVAVPAEAAAALAEAAQTEVQRVRDELGAVARGDAAPAPRPARRAWSPARPAVAPADPWDPATHRQRYQAAQQTFAARVGPLRERLRATLATLSPAHARLAALDAVMEQVLGPREQALLASVPQRLEPRFQQLLRQRSLTDAATASAGLAAFTQTLQALLRAELDTRLQPVDGLLAALRSAAPSSAAPSSHRHA